MKLPPSAPHVKLLTGAAGLYAIVWLALEGTIARDLLLAIPLLALGVGYLAARFLSGRTLSPARLVALSAVTGLACGAALSLLLLFLMALKTGLHVHGPEYTPGEIVWVWRQLPLWSGVGALGGVGLGLLAVARRG